MTNLTSSVEITLNMVMLFQDDLLVPAVDTLLNQYATHHRLLHITGGGWVEHISRILPEH